MLKLTVIISCYAAESMIDTCLTSLKHQTYPNIEVIVVDANSPDRTVEIIKSKFPEVRLVQVNRIGVGAALNIGLREASGDIIVIDFNTDEVADPFWAEYLIEGHEFYGPNFILSPARLRPNGNVGAYGLKFKYNGGAYPIGSESVYDPNRPSEICDATGINTFRKELISKIGYIDENYLFYGADVDYSLRARIAGYTVRTIPRAHTTHQRSANRVVNSQKYYERINFGIMRTSLLHGTNLVTLMSFGYYSIYMPLLAFFKTLVQFIKSFELDDSYSDLVGRIKGVVVFLKNLPRDLKLRSRYQPKLMKFI